MKTQSMALSMARKLAGKKMSHGGKCYACGGQVNPKLEESHLSEGGEVEPLSLSEGGGVDELDTENLLEADGDNTDLVYSPEEYGEKGFGAVDNEEDGGDNEARRNNFLRAYLIHKKVRRG